MLAEVLNKPSAQEIGIKQNLTEQSSQRSLERREKIKQGYKELFISAHGYQPPREWAYVSKEYNNAGNGCYDGEKGSLTEEGRQYKEQLYTNMTKIGNELDSKLDRVYPSWRKDFVAFFLGVRRAMYYSGNVREDMQQVIEEKHLDILSDPNIQDLFLAQLARFTGITSCYGFFEGGADRPERKITQENLQEVRNLIPDIDTPRSAAPQIIYAALH